MIRLNQYSFGKRIGAGFAIIILLLLAVYAEGLRSRDLVDQGINKLNAANVGVREVFGLQVLENSYVNTRDPIYAQRFNKWHKVNLDQFIASKYLFDSAINAPLVAKFETANRAYGQLFKQFNQQIISFQQLSEALQNVETQWFQNYSLVEQQLLLERLSRAREQVQASLQPEYLAQWKQSLLSLRGQLSNQNYSSYQQQLEQVETVIATSVETRKQMLTAALAVRDSAKKLLVNVEAQMAEDKQRSSMLGLVVSMCAVLACIIIGFVSTRSVVKPIKAAISMVEQLAQGELFHHLSAEGKDELASLVTAINHMSNSLHHMVGDINQNLGVLTQVTDEMTVIAAENKTGTEQQLSESEQVAAAMTQMSATMTEMSHSVNEVSENVSHSQNLIDSCNQMSDTAMDDIKVLSNNIGDAATVVNKLAQEAENISSVLDVISDISNQTNLLSLNAAIEAARAGEQGRGFAVVADEVRSLSQRTQASTQEINAIIESLRSGAGQAVAAMDISRKSVESSRHQVEEIGGHIINVAELIKNVEEQTISLSQAAVEQSVTSESFNKSLQVIVGVTRTSSETGLQLAGTAQQLARCKDEIYTHMDAFQLSR